MHPPSWSNLTINVLITVLCLVIVPFAILAGALVPPAYMASFVGAILVFQPFAAPVGLVLSIPPLVILTVMFSVGLGAVTGILAFSDLCAKRWNRLDMLIRNVQTMTENSVRFRNYGILMFFAFIWVPGLGLYGCTLLAWLFMWRRVHHIAVLMAAWMTAALIVMITSMGIFLAIS
jgi:uncharacterized membrane protein